MDKVYYLDASLLIAAMPKLDEHGKMMSWPAPMRAQDLTYILSEIWFYNANASKFIPCKNRGQGLLKQLLTKQQIRIVRSNDSDDYQFESEKDKFRFNLIF